MQWDDELATLAGLNAMKCKFEFDNCHRTKENQYPGQNIFMKKLSIVNTTDGMIETAFNTWYQSSNITTAESLKNFTGKSDK